ncbi:N-acetylmuramoyl-L-alanine amidase [Candidatus Woesearchaeota archaeon]|nr:N-acetylmuramoyl-L-alanine amidase [Candidatus Woesearchaeota archaeon]
MRPVMFRDGEMQWKVLVWLILIFAYMFVLFSLYYFTFAETGIDSRQIVYPYIRDMSVGLDFDDSSVGKTPFIRFVRKGSKIEIGGKDVSTNLLALPCGDQIPASLSSLRVLVDPAHGGSDTGYSVGGVNESEFVRMVAASIKAQNPSFDLRFTRSTENDLPAGDEMTLNERLAHVQVSNVILTLHVGYYQSEESSIRIYYVNNSEADKSEVLACHILNSLSEELYVDGVSLVRLDKDLFPLEYGLIGNEKMGLYIEIGNLKTLEAFEPDDIFGEPGTVGKALMDGFKGAFG